MNNDFNNLNNIINYNNNNILVSIANDLQQIINNPNDNLIIKKIGDIIIRINFLINDNKKTFDLISKLYIKFNQMQINNINKQELR